MADVELNKGHDGEVYRRLLPQHMIVGIGSLSLIRAHSQEKELDLQWKEQEQPTIYQHFCFCHSPQGRVR